MAAKFWYESKHEGRVHGRFLLWSWATGYEVYEAYTTESRPQRNWKKQHLMFATMRAATKAVQAILNGDPCPCQRCGKSE